MFMSCYINVHNREKIIGKNHCFQVHQECLRVIARSRELSIDSSNRVNCLNKYFGTTYRRRLRKARYTLLVFPEAFTITAEDTSTIVKFST